MVAPMDTKRPDNRELQDLLEKKENLLSLFSAFEDRIDHKISHFTDSMEIPVEKIRETLDQNPQQPKQEPEEAKPEDDIFEQAVLKSQDHSSKDGIIGYHTEEILGIDAALAAFNHDAENKSTDEASITVPEEERSQEAAPVLETSDEPSPASLDEALFSFDTQDTEEVLEILESEAETSQEAPEAEIPKETPPDFDIKPESPAPKPFCLNTEEEVLQDTPDPEPEPVQDFEITGEPPVLEAEEPEADTPAANADNIFDNLPTEHPVGVANEHLGEVSELLNEAEDLVDVTPSSRYIASQTATLDTLDDLPMEELEDDEVTEDDFETEEAACGTESTTNAFDEFFYDEDDDDEDFDDDDLYEDEPETFEAESEEAPAAPSDPLVAEETEISPKLKDEEPHPYADFFEDTPAEKEDFFDTLPLNEAPEEDYPENNLDDVTYENVDAVSLGAFKYSAVSLRLGLFVAAMLGLGIFTALSGGKFVALDYLILFVLCIFTALTMDMSLNATLIVTVVLMLSSFGGIVYTFITGGGFDLYHLFWFILIPAVLITASALVQKVKEVILANQLLNEELDRYCPAEDTSEEDNLLD